MGPSQWGTWLHAVIQDTGIVETLPPFAHYFQDHPGHWHPTSKKEKHGKYF